MKIILASRSKNRQELLEIAGIKADIMPADIAEYAIEDRDPRKRIQKIAQAKARTIAIKQKNAFVIGADTFALYRNKMVEKPKFKMDALETLKEFSGQSHVMLTGWAVINTKTEEVFEGITETRVFFREVSEDELTAYVNNHDVTQWAAGYSPLNTPAINFIERIDGSLTGFTHGLPLEKITPIILS